MKKEKLRNWICENTEVRPYNENKEGDGNWSFIHRTRVGCKLSQMQKKIETLETYRDILEDSFEILLSDKKLLVGTLEKISSLDATGYDSYAMKVVADNALNKMRGDNNG